MGSHFQSDKRSQKSSIYNGDNSDYFTIEMVCGGHPATVNGQFERGCLTVNYFDFCEMDKMSYMELVAMAKEIQHTGLVCFYWKRYTPNVEESPFLLIVGDEDVLEMCRNRPPDRQVTIYLSYELMPMLDHTMVTYSAPSDEQLLKQ
ncbi:unnamed protein product, partial [Cuscuta epithymum]